MPDPICSSASVRVLRSYDYCHFEVTLGTTDTVTLAAVDELRKCAARLADKAVEQYKVAKRNAELAMEDQSRLDTMRYQEKDILSKPEGERTARDKAILKTLEDRKFFHRRVYDYEDEWEEEPEFEPDDTPF